MQHATGRGQEVVRRLGHEDQAGDRIPRPLEAIQQVVGRLEAQVGRGHAVADHAALAHACHRDDLAHLFGIEAQVGIEIADALRRDAGGDARDSKAFDAAATHGPVLDPAFFAADGAGQSTIRAPPSTTRVWPTMPCDARLQRELRRLRDLFDADGAAQGCPTHGLRQALVLAGKRGPGLGLDAAGRKDVDPDALRRQLRRQVACQRLQRALRSSDRGIGRDGAHGAGRRHGHDRRAFAEQRKPSGSRARRTRAR
jgi:hypothetical protein